MAIEEFGQSLLAQQRQRNEQRRKEAERNQLQGLLLKVGLTVGNKLLANRTKRFMNSTEVKSAARVARASDALMADNMRIWDAIDASGKDPLQYLIDQNKPIAQQEINNQFAFKDRGTQDYEATIYKTAKQMAQDQLDALNKMRAIRMDNNLGKDEQRVQTLAKELRPSTVQDAIIGKLTGIFEGFTGQDADENELLSFEEYINDQDPASRGYLIKKYQALGEEYKRSGSLEKAYQTARDIMANKSNPADGNIVEVESFGVKESGGMLYETKRVQRYLVDAEGNRTAYGEPSERLVRNAQGDVKLVKLETEADRIRAQMEVFDWQDFTQKNFTGPAHKVFMGALRDAGIRSFGEIDTEAEYNTFQDILFEVGNNASNYKLEDEGLKFMELALKQWEEGEGKILRARILAAEGEGNTELVSKLNADFARSFGEFAQQTRERAQELPPENRPQGLEGSPVPEVSTPDIQEIVNTFEGGEVIIVTKALQDKYPSLRKFAIGTEVKLSGAM
jgi:hypothetical protein